MTQVSIAEAARLAGKDRKAIYRAVARGHISVTVTNIGTKLVDIAELERVFGALCHDPTRDNNGSLSRNDTPDSVAQLAVAKAEIAGLREVIARQDRHIEDMRITVRLLEDKRPQKRWWKPW